MRELGSVTGSAQLRYSQNLLRHSPWPFVLFDRAGSAKTDWKTDPPPD